MTGAQELSVFCWQNDIKMDSYLFLLSLTVLQTIKGLLTTLYLSQDTFLFKSQIHFLVKKKKKKPFASSRNLQDDSCLFKYCKTGLQPAIILSIDYR